MTFLISFAGSCLGSLLAWFLIFHFELEGTYQAWRYHRGHKLSLRQERLAREHKRKGQE